MDETSQLILAGLANLMSINCESHHSMLHAKCPEGGH